MENDHPHRASIGPWLALALAPLMLVALCHSGEATTEPAAASAAAPASSPAAASSPAPVSSLAVASAPPSAPASAPATPNSPPAPTAPFMTAAQVLQMLDQTIDWYRTLGVQQQTANEPSDMLFLYDDRQTAAKIMALAFDAARADAEMLAKAQPEPADTGGDNGVSAQSMAQFKNDLDAQFGRVHAELDAEHRALQLAKGAAKTQVTAKINELQGELDLITTKQNILSTMGDFGSHGGGLGLDSLKSQIDAMALAIPSATAALGGTSAGTTASTATAATAAAPVFSPASLLGGAAAAPAAAVGRFGLWDLAANAFRLAEKAGTINGIDRRTAELQDMLDQLRAPLVAQIKSLSARGDSLAAEAAHADSSTLDGVHDQFDRLATDFKQVSAMLLPLGREITLLGHYRRNLLNWRTSIDSQYRQALETLAIRLGVVLAILAVLFAGAELWRRLVLRYFQDSRRRYQLLLLRRIALWSLVVIVIGAAFASELSSIVTFAGLITAGIAVAMQSVLVSIVGYFFLIGKYGIRVGDRVQIGEVAGEVIDLGLVRMYLMELGGKGTLGPTGRVVAFANSVVFQVSSGLFKQIPGVNFSWREVILNLPAGSPHSAIKVKLLAAVTEALQDYREEIVRQSREIQRTTLSNSAGDPHPQVQLNYSASGVDAHVRYPVNLRHAAEIDERVSEALSRVVSTVPTG